MSGVVQTCKPVCCGISPLSSQAFQKRLQAKGLRRKIDSERTGSGEPNKTEHGFFLRLRRSFCAWRKACVHRNRISLTITEAKQQENRHRRIKKKSVTSDNGDGGPTLSIAVRAQGRSTDSCFRQELFSREEMDDGMLCQSSLCFYFTYMTCVSCLWFCFDKVEHFQLNGAQ